MKKYVELYWAFFRASFIADMEFRANFLTRILTDIFWYVAQVGSFEVFYQFTPKIGDWGRAETRVFLGILFVVDAIYMVMFNENLDQLPEKVRRGQLDLLLAKPVNSQFMLSLQKANTAILGNFILGASWLVWALLQRPDFSWWRTLWLLVLIPCGVCIFYCVRFLFATTSVMFTKAENIQYLWYQIYRLGMRPDSIYVPWMRVLILSIVPVGIIASVPARFLLEAPNYPMLLWAIFLAGFALFLSSRFWLYALGKYSSASS